jgi:putative transposase
MHANGVFTPQYRKKLLFGQIRRRVRTLFHGLARRKECRIEEGHHMMPDQVHILIPVPPKYSVAKVIGYLKERDLDCPECGTQAAQFSEHKFRARGYCVSIVGRDEEMVRACIRNQEMADKQLDQLQ